MIFFTKHDYDEYPIIMSTYAYASHEINKITSSLYSILAKFENHYRIEYLLQILHDTEILCHHFSSYFPFETSVKPKPLQIAKWREMNIREIS